MKDSQKQKQKKRTFKKRKASFNKPAKNATTISKKSKNRNDFFAFINRQETNALLMLTPSILIIVLATVYILNQKSFEKIQSSKLSSTLSSDIAPYPIVDFPYSPVLSAKASVVMDTETKTTLFSKNPRLRFSMASTAKIMTALVALDYYQPDSVLTIRSRGIEGSVIGLVRGDSFYFKDLLYAMLLPSANDAAVALVDNFPGGKKAFVSKMNEKAAEWNLTDTFFSDPTGLDDDGNFTTVSDLARLGALSQKNPSLSEVVATRSKVIANVRKSRQYNLVNLNRLLGYDGVNGIKTGTTEGAGEVLVTSAKNGDHRVIIVVMNSEDRFADTLQLLNFATNNVRFVVPAPPRTL